MAQVQERKRGGKGKGGSGVVGAERKVTRARNQFAEGMDMKKANIKPSPEAIKEAQRRAMQERNAKKGVKKK